MRLRTLPTGRYEGHQKRVEGSENHYLQVDILVCTYKGETGDDGDMEHAGCTKK